MGSREDDATMSIQGLLDCSFAEASKSVDYDLEWLLLDVTEKLCRLMSQESLTRAELASRLGVSRAWITKLMKCDRNVTLRSLVKVARVLDLRIELQFVPKSANYDEEWPSNPESKLDQSGAKSYLKEHWATECRGTESAIAA